MTDAGVTIVIRDCMLVIMKLAGPILCSALVVGLVVSFVQAITQINEATLAFVPKLAAIGLTLLMLGSYMMQQLSTFSHEVFDRIVVIGGS
jgi:flagellar biosynthetic protein FliQ